jgi:dTDP-4-dehydrorhamnose reductase
MLGRELVEACRNSGGGAAELWALDLEDIDIRDGDSISGMLGRLRPDLVMNAAAYTDVDGCESHQELAHAVNGAGPTRLASWCQRNGARLVHVSTDYVFDGQKRTPYVPEDPINPQSAYGHSKAEGERGVRQQLPDNHVIVRTSWLFGVHGQNFVKTILRLAGERDELRVVSDQVGCPTYAPDLALAIVALGFGGLNGTYHFCNAGACSWYEFATEIVEQSGQRTRVLETTTAEFKRPAPRPAWSVLDTRKLENDTGIRARPWREALAECIQQLTEGVVAQEM